MPDGTVIFCETGQNSAGVLLPLDQRTGANGSVPFTRVRPEMPEFACANASSLARSPMLFDAGSGARPSVERTPIALPSALMKPVPESPGMPGVIVYSGCDQPPSGASSPRLTPVWGESAETPPRRLELP